MIEQLHVAVYCNARKSEVHCICHDQVLCAVCAEEALPSLPLAGPDAQDPILSQLSHAYTMLTSITCSPLLLCVVVTLCCIL